MVDAAAPHRDADGADGKGDGKCDDCGGVVIEAHQLWTLTNEEGIYEFNNLPGYVLVDGDVVTASKPADMTKVYQPYGVPNANGTALSTSDLKVLHARPVSVKMIASLSAEDIKSLSGEQMKLIQADAELKAAYDDRMQVLADADPNFTMATPYLTGYAIKVVDDSGEYVASRFHVDGAGTGNNSDLTSFESSLTDNVNDADKANEVYAVVAEQVDEDADMNGSLLASAYAITYMENDYDLANRMYYKRAFDAGLTKRLPVLIDGDVWNDENSDGLMTEGEAGIEGAVIRLVRYWYDDAGMGYWENAAGDGSYKNSGLTKDEYKAIEAMAPAYVEDEDDAVADPAVAAQAMIDWLGAIGADLDNATAADREAVYRAALNKLNVFEATQGTSLNSYTEGPDNKRVIREAFDACIDKIGEATPEGEKGVWRRDYSFSQADLAELTGVHDLSKDGLGEHTYLPLTEEEALAVAPADEVREQWVSEDKDGNDQYFKYVPGSGFATTDENGRWEFMAYGTGTHRSGENTAEFKVLFAYRAEVVSYPEPEAYAPTLQHVDDELDDTINSDFDEKFGSLRPNIPDAAGHKGDYTLPIDPADAASEGLIVLTTLADATESESSKTQGAYATFDSQVNRDPENCDHEDGNGDGFCDACKECVHVKDGGLCTEPGCDHASDCCPAPAGTECEHVDGDLDNRCDLCGDCLANHDDRAVADTDGDGLCDTCSACLHEKDGDGFCTEAGCTHADCTARAATEAAFLTTLYQGDRPVARITVTDSLKSEVLAWIEKALLADLDELHEAHPDYHEAIFGKQKMLGGKPVYLGSDGRETTDATAADGTANAPVYDGTGDRDLYEAYQARRMELEGDNMWSDINWFSSLHHGYGLFRIAQAHIAGVVWRDDNYDGIQDAGETGRIAGVPVSLKRYWYSADGWQLDETFSQTVTSDADGRWIFDDLDVAGKRMVDGEETYVLYGFEVTVDDLPAGFGVTHMNKGSHETDSDLNEDTKLLDPADPHGGLIVLASPSDRSDLVGNGAAYLAGPSGTTWVISMGVDSDFNDTGLVPYALATIAGIAFDDPEADGLQDETAEPVPGLTVYLERKTLGDTAAVGFNGASYKPTALAAIKGQTVEGGDGWTEVASQETNAEGSYRFEGLPMVDGANTPYIYRVRATMPDGKEFVPIEVGSDDNNDSDWGEAAGSVLGTGKVGITPAMAVLGSFTEVRTTPNAYGHKFNLLAPYDWTPETDRSVDLGMTGSDDDWNTVVVTTPWGTNLFYLKLPQTGDELMPWLFGLTLLGAAALLLVLISRRKEEEEEGEGEE